MARWPLPRKERQGSGRPRAARWRDDRADRAGGVIALVVFDLDGTLVDSHQDLAFAANALVVELGGAGVSEAAVVKMVGEGAAGLGRGALPPAGLGPPTPRARGRVLAVYAGCPPGPPRAS